jgi:hypothetical protein
MEKTVKNIENVVISVQKLTQIHSTGVENIRQINLFLQNKPNFPNFPPKNEDFAKKQTQFKPNSNPIFNPRCELTCFPVGGKANFGPISRVANPNKPKTNPIFYHQCQLTLLWSLPRACPRCEPTCFSAGECVLTYCSAGGQTQWDSILLFLDFSIVYDYLLSYKIDNLLFQGVIL